MKADGIDRVWMASDSDAGLTDDRVWSRATAFAPGSATALAPAWTAFAAELPGGDGQRLHVSTEQEDQRDSDHDRVKGGGD